MQLLPTFFRPKVSEKQMYASVRSSEDDVSQDGLLRKERLRDYESQPPSAWRRYGKFILVQVILIAIYTGLLYIAAAKTKSQCYRGQPLSHSPASEAIVWEEKQFTLGDKITEKSVFSGRPSPSVDKAWHDLLDIENIGVDPPSIERLGRQSNTVKIPGEDRYLVTLNKRIHQHMYQEHYYKNLDDNQRELNRVHNEHCIDFLRQSAMCHADVGMITYEWSPESRIPIANATSHQCANWGVFTDWVKDRTVDVLKPGWLKHPTLGASYPNGEGDIIGAHVPGHHM